MKKIFESFKDHLEHINENTDYTYKEDSGGGKPTMVLKLEPEAWDNVKTLFDKDGRPVDDEVKNLPINDKYKWGLYAQPTKYSDGITRYKIYGVSGDATFGNAPTYYQKIAKKAFEWFIGKYLK
jgi:hypothetical protein